jgi:hypothetical protein
MPASLAASTFLVDGVDVLATGVTLAHDGAGVWDGLEEDVSVATYAGVDGGTVAGGDFRPYVRSVEFLVRGADYDTTWARIRALRRRCKPGQTVTLTRQMPDQEGVDTNASLTTTAHRQTDRVMWAAPGLASVDVDWLIVGGPWSGAQVTITNAAGTRTILGDLRTQKVTATLSAGAVNPTVANTTNGFSFTWTGTVPTGGVEVDVVQRKATKLSDSSDVSSALTWAKVAPFQLNPGDNVITVSSGTCDLAYYPAYE